MFRLINFTVLILVNIYLFKDLEGQHATMYELFIKLVTESLTMIQVHQETLHLGELLSDSVLQTQQFYKVQLNLIQLNLLPCMFVCHLYDTHLSFICVLSRSSAVSNHFQKLFSFLFVFCHIASYLLSFVCAHSVCLLCDCVHWFCLLTPVLFEWMNEWMNESGLHVCNTQSGKNQSIPTFLGSGL